LNVFGRPDKFDPAESADVYNHLPEIVENIENTPQKPVLGTVKPGGFVDLLSLKRPGAGVTISPNIPSPLAKSETKPKKRKTAEPQPAEEPKPKGPKPETKGVQQDEESKLAFAQSQFRAVVEQCVREMFPDKPAEDVRVWPSEDAEYPWEIQTCPEGLKWAVKHLAPVVEELGLKKTIATREDNPDNPGWTARNIADILLKLPEPAKAAGKLLDEFLSSGVAPKGAGNDF